MQIICAKMSLSFLLDVRRFYLNLIWNMIHMLDVYDVTFTR